MNLVLMGVAGSGKTTIGRKLAARLGGGWRFDDADDFHPPANIDKMGRGIPLSDADRTPWLDALRAHCAACAARGESVVLACSGLKEMYRRRLVAPGGSTHFIYLQGDFATFLPRLQCRQEHFMKAAMLRGQFEALEEPAPGTALVIDAALPPDDIVARILQHLAGRTAARDSSPRPP